MKNIFFTLLLSSAVISCTTNSFKTSAGTKVTYFKKGDGEMPIDSLIGLYAIRYTREKGEVMSESDPQNPLPLKIDPNDQPQQGELYEILAQLRTGDSVGFDLVADELFSKTFNAPMPDSIAPDEKIKFQIACIDQLTETGYHDMIAEKAKQEEEKQLAIDSEILNDYLVQNNIETERTESGLRYIITEQSSGSTPENGQVVHVNYSGWVLGGKYFDTSVEKVAREQSLYQEGRSYKPFSFPLGQGQVIKGWDEGIALLNVGSKARLYIPSTLAYQTRQISEIIMPNAILIFDVELVGLDE